jgi:parvulin-like peptidyl-prolyl isomerase
MERCCWAGIFLAVLGFTSGCVSGPTGLGGTYSGSLAEDMADTITPRLTRLQRGDSTETTFRPELKGPPTPTAPMGPPTLGNGPAPQAPGTFKINVRAWVNGKPLFEEEVMQGLPPALIRELQSMPEAQRREKILDYEKKQLESLIDQEVMYQDAVAKLEKGNPKALDKLKALAQQDYDKKMKQIRENNKIRDEDLRDLARLLYRKTEREFIAMEYMRSKIFPPLVHAIGFQEVKEYYDTHQNEFQKIETVKWQDIFIPVGPKFSTVAQAKRYAEDLIDQCRTVEDFEKLLVLDEGDSKFRNGEGFGSRRGEIKPPEVEEHLFKLRDGEIGPVVEISTGVHIIRLVKREPGGIVPLNETVQLQIRNRLRNEVADREVKRLVRGLRNRAVIEYEDLQ